MTKYCVSFKLPSGNEMTMKYDSMLERALFIISHSQYTIKEWIE